MQTIKLVQLPLPELQAIVQQELQKFFNSNSVMVKQERPILRVVDLDGLLKERPIVGSKSTIYKKVMKGDIPHSKRGKRLYFDLDTIDDWLLSNRTLTPTEIEQKKSEYFKKRSKK